MKDKVQHTMQTIADAAGVSRMTVSRALRNDPRLSEATSRRIQTLAHDLGYHPNPAVSELMAQVRQRRVVPQVATIAHITEAYPPGVWRTYPFTGEIILGAEERAKELG